MKRALFACALYLFGCCLAPSAAAQSPVDAHWIWHDAGNPAESAPAGSVWFRHEVRASEPSTGLIRIACDDAFVLWVNGQKVGEGSGNRSYRFNLNGIVERGPNVFCVEATNADGKAGLFVDGEVRGQGGSSIPFDSNASWKSTTAKPEDAWLTAGFDTSSWSAAKDLGGHADSPWREIDFSETYLDRFQLAEGFVLERIAEPELVGSLVAMTWGNDGILFASQEGGPVLAVRDTNNDGKYDTAEPFSNELTNCQGLCMVGDDLYLVGVGPQGTGLYLLPDKNHDGKADSVQMLTTHKGGMGEHGPHDVILGPDGWLYHNTGNHAWVQNKPEPNSPVTEFYEGDFLRPRYEDPNGHAAGIPAPGGTVWRLSRDGQRWWLHTLGFRNHYDIAVNGAGDIFTFDSDMEWEVGMPFYKPVRVAHCTPGADYGWRSNAAKWPAYFPDTLPTVADIGRGSPTGVIFYEHDQFPDKYQGAFLACDWSMGRIIAVYPKPVGASYTATWDVLVAGNPLNVSDIEVDRDGSVVFTTGGRRTEGGIYRVRHSQSQHTLPAALTELTLDSLLTLPQYEAAWAREVANKVREKMGPEAWGHELSAIAADDRRAPAERIRALTLLAQWGPAPNAAVMKKCATAQDAKLRAFAVLLLESGPIERRTVDDLTELLRTLLDDVDPVVQRRAAEACLRNGVGFPQDLIRLYSSQDRFVQTAARISVGRFSRQFAGGFQGNNLRASIQSMLAVVGNFEYRLGVASDIWEQAVSQKDWTSALESLRVLQLVLIDHENTNSAVATAAELLQSFPITGVEDEATADGINRELARLFCYLQAPGAAEKITAALAVEPNQQTQIHYALCVSYFKGEWSPAAKLAYMDWYNGTEGWEGGHSFSRYLENITTTIMDRFTPEDRATLLTEWKARPFATRLVLSTSQPGQIAGYDQIVKRVLDELEQDSDAARREGMISFVLDAVAKSNSAESKELLRSLFERHADRRDQLARLMAQQPAAEDWPLLVSSLNTDDSTTLQFAIKALRDLPRKPEKPGEYRPLILAALRLKDQGGLQAIHLLEHWTGISPSGANGVEAAAKVYQDWFASTYPDESPVALPQDDAAESRYTFKQLSDLIEANQADQPGDPAKGKEIFTKAKCVKCHKFGSEGEGVGPDLTAVRRRFQRKEIIESLIYPSQVISDQYKTLTVETNDGLIHTGMPVPDPAANDLVLLLADATRIRVAKDNIAMQSTAKISVMPQNVLKELEPQEIVDLFAFLETSKQNEVPAAGGQ